MAVVVIPARAGIQYQEFGRPWFPAYAGMTNEVSTK